MSGGDSIQVTLDAFAREAGFTETSGTWYRRNLETVALVQLQKSRWGPQYYVNFALWLTALGDTDHPKEPHCHIRTRLSRLVPSEIEARLKTLLDLDAVVSGREDELMALLRTWLLPVFGVTETLEQLRSGPGRAVLKAALVVGPAQQLLNC